MTDCSFCSHYVYVFVPKSCFFAFKRARVIPSCAIIPHLQGLRVSEARVHIPASASGGVVLTFNSSGDKFGPASERVCHI